MSGVEALRSDDEVDLGICAYCDAPLSARFGFGCCDECSERLAREFAEQDRASAPVELPEPTVPGEGLLTWDSQVRQYPKVGPPGLSIDEVETTIAQVTHKPTGTVVAEVRATVDCVLYRNRKGHLIGILNHYPTDCYEFDGTLLEAAGNVNLWVRPDRRRRGVGSRLLAAAARRWSIDWSTQRYTEAGRGLVSRFLEGSER